MAVARVFRRAMLEAANPVQSESIATGLAWWAEVGVDTVVAETPRGWLKRAAPPVAEPEPEQPPSKPLSLEAFYEVMHDLPGLAVPRGQRLAASGNPKSGLMIVIDMPEPGDVEAGHLLSGEAGALFDKMLAAIGRDRTSCYITALCPGRLAGGMVPDELIELLASLARQHIALVSPERLWSVGQTANRVLIGADALLGRADLRKIYHEGGSVEAVASFSPRVLLQFPKRKAAAWADMQALMRGTST